jgi:hypothetical protein
VLTVLPGLKLMYAALLVEACNLGSGWLASLTYCVIAWSSFAALGIETRATSTRPCCVYFRAWPALTGSAYQLPSHITKVRITRIATIAARARASTCRSIPTPDGFASDDIAEKLPKGWDIVHHRRLIVYQDFAFRTHDTAPCTLFYAMVRPYDGNHCIWPGQRVLCLSGLHVASRAILGPMVAPPPNTRLCSRAIFGRAAGAGLGV